jgi:hypothetical protein
VLRQDPVLEALTELERVLDANIERARKMKERIHEIRAARAEGRSYVDIVRNEEGPLIVQMLSQNATALDTYGVRLRRAEARALYDEGMNMEQIAVLFGVTRQRVSALLKVSSQ